MKKKAAKSTKRTPIGKPKRPTDINEFAHLLVERSTQETPVASAPTEPSQAEISRVMAALGRRGGQIGGKKRSESLTPERRREFALKAARAKWDKPTQ